MNQDPVGALSSTFARLQSSKPLRELRGRIPRCENSHDILLLYISSVFFCTLAHESAKAITKQMPVPVQEVTAKVDEYARGMISGSGSTLFEELW